MNRFLGILILLTFLSGCARGIIVPPPGGNGGNGEEDPPPETTVYLIDDFEDENYITNPEWWDFDSVTLTIQNNQGLSSLSEVEDYSLHITGEAIDYYVGGCGTYLGRNATEESKVGLDIYGYGADSGKIKIELFDDDAGTWEVSYDGNQVYNSGDLWICEIPVTWSGWKYISKAFSDFQDDNSYGNGDWDPVQEGESGGLLQLQFIALASSQTGSCNFNVDNVKLTKPQE